MAVETPPAFTQANTFGAEQTRRTIASLLDRGASIGSIAGGLVGGTDCALTPPGSGMTVNVAPGEVWVPGSSSATQSGYYCRVTSSTSLAVAASDPSNPRVDRVSAVVTDAAYSGATNTFAVAVETGTPTVGATLVNLTGAAAAPASSYTLGYVLVPAGSSNVTGGNISNVGVVATAGLIPSRGAVTIAATQSVTSTSFTTLGTPDQVTGIVLPASGLIAVWYEATWQSSVSTAGSAAIFIGASQLVTSGGATPPVQAATTNGTANNAPLHSVPYGLTTVGVTAYTGDATTGQAIGDGSTNTGGPCWIFAAAGTYTISIQFKSTSGSVTASNRKLWVEAKSFA